MPCFVRRFRVASDLADSVRVAGCRYKDVRELVIEQLATPLPKVTDVR